MSFEDSFWGVEDEHRGFKVLLGRLKYGRHSTEALLSYISTRVEIEEEYVRRMARLGNTAFPREGLYFGERAKDVVGAPIAEHDLAGAMLALPRQTAELCSRHGTLIDSLRQRLLWPLEHSLKEQTAVKRQHKQEMLRITKAKSAQADAVSRLAERLRNRQQERDALLRADASGLAGRDLDKHELKVRRAKEAEHQTDAEYRSAIYRLHELHTQWVGRMQAAAAEFQKLEETRLELIKTCLVEYSYINKCHMQEQACAYEQLEHCARLCDRTMELADFVHRRGTGSQLKEPPTYKAFVNESVEDSLRRLSIRPLTSPRRLYGGADGSSGSGGGADGSNGGGSGGSSSGVSVTDGSGISGRSSSGFFNKGSLVGWAEDDGKSVSSTIGGAGYNLPQSMLRSTSSNSFSANSFSARSTLESIVTPPASRSHSVASKDFSSSCSNGGGGNSKSGGSGGSILFKVRAKWNLPAEGEGYLVLAKGDIVNVTGREDDGGLLYYGHVDGRSAVEGYFSSAYVVRI